MLLRLVAPRDQLQREHAAMGRLATRRAAVEADGEAGGGSGAGARLARPAEAGGGDRRGGVGAPLVCAQELAAHHVHRGAKAQGRAYATGRRPRRRGHALRHASEGRGVLQVGHSTRHSRRRPHPHACRGAVGDAPTALDAQRALHCGEQRGGGEADGQDEADGPLRLDFQEVGEEGGRAHGQGVAAAVVRPRDHHRGGEGRHAGAHGEAHLLPHAARRLLFATRGRGDPAARDDGRARRDWQDQRHGAPHHAADATARLGAGLARGEDRQGLDRAAAAVGGAAQGGASPRRVGQHWRAPRQGAVDGVPRRGVQAGGDLGRRACALQHDAEDGLFLLAHLHAHGPEKEGGVACGHASARRGRSRRRGQRRRRRGGGRGGRGRRALQLGVRRAYVRPHAAPVRE
mmetsp:Transcript_6647/g.16135  ORF Transcript_6647/g.16135 Transcript_6647/m.16135 type:complete len:403 (-) Transcript_6647:811-2019(-)